ncbi:hypothetical protein ACMGE6_10595 [Macrococcus equi]|uniref:hypothetical protein n=1 Tax=Macrococcus equi TaxID=3395462 RepID=UPI0039BE489F
MKIKKRQLTASQVKRLTELGRLYASDYVLDEHRPSFPMINQDQLKTRELAKFLKHEREFYDILFEQYEIED